MLDLRASSRQLPLRTAVLFAVLLIVAALVGMPALAQEQPRSFTAAVTTPTDKAVGAGSRANMVMTLTNTSSGPHQLGSADITLPSGFTLPGGQSVVKLRNLSLQPGASHAAPFTVDVPCATGAAQFHVRAKQANNFNGPPGNDLTLIGEQPSVTVTGSCGNLTFFTPPADAEVGKIITGTAGDETATKVQVRLAHNEVGVQGAVVTISLDAGGNAGALTCAGSPCTATTGDSGIATFTLSVTAIGADYRLVASKPGVDPVTSRAFSIWEDIARCQAGSSCEVGANRRRSLDVTIRGRVPTATAAAATTADDLVLFLSLLDAGALTCNPRNDPSYPWNHAPSTVLFDLTGGFDDIKVATLRIDKSEVQKVVNNGASFYQICFLADEGGEFMPRGGGALTLGPALLPDCKGSDTINPPPCVESRTKTSGGDMLMVVHLPPADPMFR